jgi:hypothetical protein
MKTSIKMLAAAILSTVAFMAAPVDASVIYDNGMPNLASGNEMTQWVQAEDFRLAATATFSSVSFSVLNSATLSAPTLNYYLFANTGAQPGALLASGAAKNLIATVTGRSYFGFLNETAISFDLDTAFTATANTTYWLGLQMGNTGGRTYWETTDVNGTAKGQESFGSPSGIFSGNGQEHGFALSTAGAVPEPATWAMMIGGFGMVGGAMRRRKSATVRFA